MASWVFFRVFSGVALAFSVASCASLNPTGDEGSPQSITAQASALPGSVSVERFHITALVNPATNQLAKCAAAGGSGGGGHAVDLLTFRAIYDVEPDQSAGKQAQGYYRHLLESAATGLALREGRTPDPHAYSWARKWIEFAATKTNTASQAFAQARQGGQDWVGEKTDMRSRVAPAIRRTSLPKSLKEHDRLALAGGAALNYMEEAISLLGTLCDALDGRDNLDRLALPDGWAVAFRVDGGNPPESGARASAIHNVAVSAIETIAYAHSTLPQPEALVVEVDGTIRRAGAEGIQRKMGFSLPRWLRPLSL